MITRNNANCYYIYREKPLGFEYELAKAFSQSLGVQLEVKTANWQNILQTVNSKQGDFIAANLTITPWRDKKVDFSESYMKIQQQIIAHRNNRSIKDIKDLKNRSIHVRQGTTYQKRLEELNRDYNLNMKIVLHKDTPTEELMRRVAEKKIEVTVADSNIALLNRRYYPDIRIAFPLAVDQYLGWAVQEGNNELQDRINNFLEQSKKNGVYGKIYEKYYGNVHIFDYVDLKKYHNRIKTRLPKYKAFIKETANKFEFDWRLIAAMIYQESHFNPLATSFTGVQGLMQVTLDAAQEMGISNRLDPQQSVYAGVKYLKKLYDRWETINAHDRILFALASYNIGYGHVKDAQNLARQMNLNPTSWSSLKKTLPLLRIKKYYSQTKYGYARGTEPVRYITRIKLYYDILKNNQISSRQQTL
jgi:membrane-bound lytic murein transglycosylase F